MNIFAKILYVLSSGCILLTAADGISGVSQGHTNSVLASVNGEAIILSDILPYTRTREYEVYAAYSGARREKAIYDLRLKAVNDLIDRKLILADYKKQTFTIAQSDLESEIDRMAEQMGCRSREEFRRRLRSNGEDPQRVRKEIEEQMIIQYMMMRQTRIFGEVTPKEVYDYFQSHEKEFSGVERVGLDMLRLEPKREHIQQETEEISAILKRTPERFSELVRRYAPESGDGRLGEIERIKLRPEFSALLQNFSIGDVLGPLVLDDGVFWLRVRSHAKPQKADFSSVEKQIRDTLMREKRLRIMKEYTDQLKSQAVIEYNFVPVEASQVK